MNQNKFDLIIWTNDTLLLEECLHYIDHLIVPDGFEVDILTIPDAAYMTQGYNEAMQSSDAQYKIYMHQDVFILNKHILIDILSIFASDPLIGMIGMVGYNEVSPTGVMWHTLGFGNLYMRNPNVPYPPLQDYRYSVTEDGYGYAALIDGFLMVTRQDISWDTEKLDGWDFYDAVQSLRFLLNGYKIAVPIQRHPWCIHDDNRFPNLFQYNHYRHIFMQQFQGFLGKSFAEIWAAVTDE